MIIIKLQKPPLLRDILGNTKTNIARSLKMSSKLVKSNIKKELRSPNKSGTLVANFNGKKSANVNTAYGIRRRFSERRSAVGESLARDTGASERLISSEIQGNTMKAGFKENPFGFDYISYQENEKNRPTLKKAVEKSERGIDYIFDKNLKPKK